MKWTASAVCFVLAAVCFLAAAFRYHWRLRNGEYFDFTDAALFLLVLGYLFQQKGQ